MMTKRFEDELASLTAMTAEMGRLAARMVSDAAEALDRLDKEKATAVIALYPRIDTYDAEIEDRTLRFLQLFQPTSADVRRAATILKSITYLERVGKYSKNVCKTVMHLADMPEACAKEPLPAMGDEAAKMIALTVEGFVSGDITEFDRLDPMDDLMDTLRDRALKDGIARMRAEPDLIETETYCISLSRYFERIGDLSCKMAEKVVYMVTGERRTINPQA
jgi:phosphate transport system protein